MEGYTRTRKHISLMSPKCETSRKNDFLIKSFFSKNTENSSERQALSTKLTFQEINQVKSFNI